MFYLYLRFFMIFNMLNQANKSLWVPILGRVLYRFVDFIERKPPNEKPTYQIKDSVSIHIDAQSKIK